MLPPGTRGKVSGMRGQRTGEAPMPRGYGVPRAGLKRCWIPKPGKPEKRPSGIPAIRDRVVQAACKLVIEPIFETNFLAWRKGFKICEVPIIFVDRRVGVSKMSKHIVYEAAWMVWKLKLKSLFHAR